MNIVNGCQIMCIVLLWFSVAWFYCQSFGDVSPTCVHIIFSLVWVAEWPSWGERAAHSVDHMFSL